jgi:hypothetical protein
MQTATLIDPIDRVFAALLRDDVDPAAVPLGPEEFLDACRDRNLAALVHARIGGADRPSAWRALEAALAPVVRDDAARELLRQRELVAVLAALADEGVWPILLKGAALAYSIYESPSLRPRLDTDLIIPRDRVERTRRVMGALGYHAPLQCDGELLFCQFPLERTDEYGLTHAFDVHWRISTQSMFAGILPFDALSARARPVPALGPHARVPCAADALLLACIHPAMHHRNALRLLWLFDIHLLASRLTAGDWQAFVDCAIAGRVSAVCEFQLRAAREVLNSPVPGNVIGRLRYDARDEPSAEYLEPDRTWIHEHLASLRGLTRWRDRVRLLREVAFPAPAYVLARSEHQMAWLTAPLLPYLYARRLVVGIWKVATGRK